MRLAWALVLLSAAPASDWPKWRGPNADGVAAGGDPLVRWNGTENVRWHVELPGWGTVSGKNKLTAFDAATHEQIWQYGEGEGPFNGEIIVSPVAGDGVVFFQLWRQSPILAVRLRPNRQPPQPVWVSEKPGPQEPSPVYYQGLSLMDNGVLICLDGKTGKEVYRRRLGGACNSSPVAAAGRIYVSNNDGETFVIRAGREF
jgi:outer membrane protein assembly factor BamB